MGRIECVTDNYTVVDLETTGFSHFSDSIIEIGAIKYEAGAETDRFNVLVKTDKALSEKIVILTGISNDMLQRDGIEEKEAIMKFSRFVGESILVGHNFTSFDSKFLEDAYVRSINRPFTNDYIDTMYLARNTMPGMQSYRLGCLAKLFNVDYSKAHRAIEDCVINHLVYEYLSFGRILCKESATGVINGFNADMVNITSDALSVEEELVEADLSEGWRAKLSAKFGNIEKELGLMEQSFVIMANKGKDGISSYAIRVYEPDLVEAGRDSSKYTTLARVKENVLKSNVNIVEVYSKSFGSSDEKKRFEQDSDELIDCLIECIHYGINNYVPKATGFACCSRYQLCSDSKRCIHPNMLYAKACQYRRNIEAGNVFF
ncbi:MAG: 3'-5' exonuclease [Lachnospiraceae bacterium]|nr:3'-5' exonuclease [Lachnospiraceae bacterium]